MNFLPLNLHPFSFPKARAWGSSLQASCQGHIAGHPSALTPSLLFSFLVCVGLVWTWLGPGDALGQRGVDRRVSAAREQVLSPGKRQGPVVRECLLCLRKKGKKSRVLGAEWLEMMSMSCGLAVIIGRLLHQLYLVFLSFFIFFLKQHMLNIRYNE